MEKYLPEGLGLPGLPWLPQPVKRPTQTIRFGGSSFLTGSRTAFASPWTASARTKVGSVSVGVTAQVPPQEAVESSVSGGSPVWLLG